MENLGTGTGFPVRDVYLVLYIQNLAEVKGSKSAVEEIVNSLAWLHQFVAKPSPSQGLIVNSILSGLQRMLARKKKPMSKEILSDMVDDTYKSDTLSNLRLCAACLLIYEVR